MNTIANVKIATSAGKAANSAAPSSAATMVTSHRQGRSAQNLSPA
jgi:hypothetical protein